MWTTQEESGARVVESAGLGVEEDEEADETPESMAAGQCCTIGRLSRQSHVEAVLTTVILVEPERDLFPHIARHFDFDLFA